MAGSSCVARHFPFCVGRSASAHFRIEDDGIWENHLTFSRGAEHTIELTAHPGALVSVNDQAVSNSPLRNGDVIELGAVRILFALSPTRQRGLRFREGLVWIGLMLVALLEVGLIYWLIG